MDAIFSFFRDLFAPIFDFFSSVGAYIVDLHKNMVTFLRMIPVSIQALTSSIGALPSLVVTFAATAIIISVAMVIVGREHGG